MTKYAWVLLWWVTGIASAQTLSLSQDRLLDKIKGGWAGQTIGVTYGWPTEFVHMGTFIPDYQPIHWDENYVARAMTEFPGLFDDIYMDLTFVETYRRLGLNAPADSFAVAYARKEYELWHANQAGRYNVRQGLRPPASGHWLHNPHADDIDFQIEADFAGLMSPAMPRAAAAVCDKIGHIMNSGDGYYGGLYVATLYSLAFTDRPLPVLVREALKAIPPKSTFHQCVSDAIRWHDRFPADWKRAWFELQRRWAEDTGCPDGVFHPLDIDAKMNAAYVVLGLLYGKGDYSRTLDIATRLGQDSDCNPSTAAGILGTWLGYSGIPERWLSPVRKAETRPFSHTSLSLQQVYEVGFEQALAHIRQNGGQVSEKLVRIPMQSPLPALLEENFKGHVPLKKTWIGKSIETEYTFQIEKSVGFVLRGYVRKKQNGGADRPVRAALYVDGIRVEEAAFPVEPNSRRTELFWRYQLDDRPHDVRIVILNPEPGYDLFASECLLYGKSALKSAR